MVNLAINAFSRRPAAIPQDRLSVKSSQLHRLFAECHLSTKASNEIDGACERFFPNLWKN